jgi:hypothetical protein
VSEETTALALLVREMRDAQKYYFMTKDRQALNKSKSLELQVDHAVTKALMAQKEWVTPLCP